jgi:hypothetical protein
MKMHHEWPEVPMKSWATSWQFTKADGRFELAARNDSQRDSTLADVTKNLAFSRAVYEVADDCWICWSPVGEGTGQDTWTGSKTSVPGRTPVSVYLSPWASPVAAPASGVPPRPTSLVSPAPPRPGALPSSETPSVTQPPMASKKSTLGSVFILRSPFLGMNGTTSKTKRQVVNFNAVSTRSLRCQN